ncbi:MAG: dockerin type I domain-containing protein [Planctomycetota bacterium]
MHRPSYETLERRNLLAGDIGHNFVEAEDVNLDGEVSAIDALNVINELGRRNRGGAVQSGNVSQILADVDSNGQVTPLDALRIINQLSRPQRSPSELEAGADRLAQAILSEDLPGSISQETADRWLERLEHRTETTPSRQGPFNRLDANDDGLISEDEVPEEIWDHVSKADADESGSVTEEELRAARPSEDTVNRPKPEAANAFSKLDANEDGSLTVDEVSEKGWARISQADSNGDGGVTLEEIQAARADREDGVQRPEPGQRFAALDLDEDGLLAEDEVSEELWNKVSEADGNDDGGISIQELRELRESRANGPTGTGGGRATIRR